MTEHKKAWWFSNEHSLPDGSYIDSCGDVGYIKSGKLHREDGPAVESISGCKSRYKSWYKNGKLHREDGPAIEYNDGYRSWYVNGEHYTEIAYEEALKVWKMNEAMK